ncbi:MAG TPA: helix-turn-helix domain-containing protein [Gemmatimonadota bacterium]|nr:helix-turn-helix domain-containing protein [Gemmatimonadota bacterium]
MVTGISDGTIARALDLLEIDIRTLSEAIGCTPGTLNRWRRGGQNPSSQYLERLELLDALLYQVQSVLRSRQRAREWFSTRVPALGNRTPRDVFLSGNFAHLVVYLRQHERL